MRLLLPLLLGTTLLSACGDQEVPAAELGIERFSDPAVSTSRFNKLSCATCHVVEPGAPFVVPGRLDPGYNLAGAPTRGSWWGGGTATLLEAINVCIGEFMGGRALLSDSDHARQLDAYLRSVPPAAGTPTFTFVRTVSGLKEVPGDATRGKEAYQKACYRCHGEIHSAKGSAVPTGSILPESTLSRFGAVAREVTVEKTRHGRFINIGGFMPFYTREAMSDQTLADILVHMGL